MWASIVLVAANLLGLVYWYPRRGQAAKQSSIVGWIATACITVVATMMALAPVGDPTVEVLTPAAFAVVIGGILAAWAAVNVPRLGSVYVPAGIVLMVIYRGGVGLPFIVLGLLFWFGHPRPQRVASWLVVIVPAVAAIIGIVVRAVGGG